MKKYMKRIGLMMIMMCMVAGIIFAVTKSQASEETRLWLLPEGSVINQDDPYYTVDESGVPVYDGYLFAGYYVKNVDSYTVVKSIEGLSEGTYYAKFVPKGVLGIKAQVSRNILEDEVSDTTKNMIRFVTTIDDSLDYKKVGFMINVGGYANIDAEVDKYVFERIYAVGAKTETQDVYEPSVFDTASKYFKTWTFTNVPEEYLNTDITVTPYWITMDGTTVYGTTATRTANYCRGWFYVSSDAYDAGAANVGTKNSPATLETAVEIPVDTTLITPKIYVTDDIQIEKEVVVNNSAEIIGVDDLAKSEADQRVVISAADGITSSSNAFIKVNGGAELDVNNIIVDASAANNFYAIYVPAESATEIALADAKLVTSNKNAVFVNQSGKLTMTEEDVEWSCEDASIKSITNCEANVDNVYYLKLAGTAGAWKAAVDKNVPTTVTLTNDCTITGQLEAITTAGKNITIDGQKNGQNQGYKLTADFGTSANNVFNINLTSDHAKVNLNIQNITIDHNAKRSLVSTGASTTSNASPQVNVNNATINVFQQEFGVFNFRDNATIFMKDTTVTVTASGTGTDRGIIRPGNGSSTSSDNVTVYARLENCTLDASKTQGVSVARINNGNTLNIKCQECTLKTNNVNVFNKTSTGTLTASVDNYTDENAVRGGKTNLQSGGTCTKVDNLDKTSAGATIGGFLYADLQTAWTDAQSLDGFVTIKMLKDSNWATTGNVEMDTPYVDITIDGQEEQYKLTAGRLNASHNAFYIDNDNISLTLKNMDIEYLSSRAVVRVAERTPVNGAAVGQNINVSLDNVNITTAEFDASTTQEWGLFYIRNNMNLYMKDVTIEYKNSQADFEKNSYTVIRFGNGTSDGTIEVQAELENCTVNMYESKAAVFGVVNGATVTIEAKGCTFNTYMATLVYRGAGNNVTLRWWNTSTWKDVTETKKTWVNTTNCNEGYSCTKEDVTE